MKNLKNLGVQELNASDNLNTSGGWAWLVQAAIGTFLYEVVNDWDANVAAFNAGYAKGV